MKYFILKKSISESNQLRIIVSVLAALFIVLHGRWPQIHEAVVSLPFYFAFLLSAAMTYLLLYIVHIGTIVLNKYYPWQQGFAIRIFLQLLVGLVLPALIDLLFAEMYLSTIGQDLIESGFLTLDFPVIVFFLGAANGYYYKHRQDDTAIDQDTDTKDECVPIIIKHNGTTLNLDVNKDILCLIKEGKYLTVITMSGDEYQLNDTLSSLQDRFRHTNLTRVNRSTFFNKDSMLGFRIGDKPRTLEIILKPPYNDHIDLSRRGYLVVTGHHVATIREYFKMS
ncbi:MAG: LytTR family transcriptional regulator [Flavobacteriia bacterium]|nr:LytTR family transcriptional regulator [Flavobacteriia bacterium]OJX36598.1 MAG: hypothetical protein BGO87_12410 [Flavobacteriia bacterium 40-80]